MKPWWRPSPAWAGGLAARFTGPSPTRRCAAGGRSAAGSPMAVWWRGSWGTTPQLASASGFQTRTPIRPTRLGDRAHAGATAGEPSTAMEPRMTDGPCPLRWRRLVQRRLLLRVTLPVVLAVALFAAALLDMSRGH